VATTLFGILTGHWLRSERPRFEKVVGMFVAGAVCVALGWAWNPFFPINKSLWTSSYVLFTAGLALQFLGLCYWLIDIKGYRRWAWPFEVFGVNALALFVGSALMVKLMGVFKVQGWIFRNLFLSWAEPINASLAYAIAFILLWLFLMWLLYRKNVIIKV
jgi:predicted acyltransferase